ncbi:MAG: hypothetical protein HOC71_11270 [Candidatus Latescibacteria bacterium]|jgi:hypothetical protein|nr:hypothetical protein [Candidatus Latescibacterota bacterium]
MPLFPDKEQFSKLPISVKENLVSSIEPDDTIIEVLSSNPRAGVRALASLTVDYLAGE